MELISSHHKLIFSSSDMQIKQRYTLQSWYALQTQKSLLDKCFLGSVGATEEGSVGTHILQHFWSTLFTSCIYIVCFTEGKYFLLISTFFSVGVECLYLL